MSTAWTGCCKGRGRKGGDLAGPRGPRTGSEPDPSSASRGIEEPGGTPRLTVETPLVNGGERAEGAGLDPVGDADLGDLEPRLTYPAAQIVTQTEVVRGKPELRRKTTRRLKAAS